MRQSGQIPDLLSRLMRLGKAKAGSTSKASKATSEKFGKKEGGTTSQGLCKRLMTLFSRCFRSQKGRTQKDRGEGMALLQTSSALGVSSKERVNGSSSGSTPARVSGNDKVPPADPKQVLKEELASTIKEIEDIEEMKTSRSAPSVLENITINGRQYTFETNQDGTNKTGGEGAFGKLYLASDPSGKRTGIKIQRDKGQGDFLAKTAAEVNAAKTARGEGHYNFGEIVDVAKAKNGKTTYIVMEFIDESQELTEKVESDGGYDRTESTRKEFDNTILPQFADIYRQLDATDVRHCDIKTDNMRVTKEGRLVLLDFGLSQVRGKSPVTLNDNQVCGTKGYIKATDDFIRNGLNENNEKEQQAYALGITIMATYTGQAAESHDGISPQDCHKREIKGFLEGGLYEEDDSTPIGAGKDILPNHIADLVDALCGFSRPWDNEKSPGLIEAAMARLPTPTMQQPLENRGHSPGDTDMK